MKIIITARKYRPSASEYKCNGCVLHNDYHQNIVKTYFNRPNFPFPPLSNKNSGGTKWNYLIVLGLAVALVDAFPPMIMEFPRAVQMTSCAALHWAYPSSKSLKTDSNSRTKRRECLFFKITWAQINLRDARFLCSLYVGAVVWPGLSDRDTLRWCFDLGFRDQMAASKSTTNPKWRMRIRACQNKPWNLCTTANHTLNTWYNVSSMM